MNVTTNPDLFADALAAIMIAQDESQPPTVLGNYINDHEFPRQLAMMIASIAAQTCDLGDPDYLRQVIASMRGAGERLRLDHKDDG